MCELKWLILGIGEKILKRDFFHFPCRRRMAKVEEGCGNSVMKIILGKSYRNECWRSEERDFSAQFIGTKGIKIEGITVLNGKMRGGKIGNVTAKVWVIIFRDVSKDICDVVEKKKEEECERKKSEIRDVNYFTGV